MKYAIVESGGKQYKVVEGETLAVDRLPVEIGKNVKLEQVLLLADGDAITVGTPLVKETTIWTTVVEHFRGEKVTIFNYAPKKRIRVKTGHRQNYTRLLVEQIGGSTLVKKEPAKKAEPVEKKPAAPKKEAKAEVEAEEAVKPAKKAAAKPAAEKAPAAPKKAAPKKSTTKAAPAKTTKTTKAPAKKPAAK